MNNNKFVNLLTIQGVLNNKPLTKIFNWIAAHAQTKILYLSNSDLDLLFHDYQNFSKHFHEILKRDSQDWVFQDFNHPDDSFLQKYKIINSKISGDDIELVIHSLNKPIDIRKLKQLIYNCDFSNYYFCQDTSEYGCDKINLAKSSSKTFSISKRNKTNLQKELEIVLSNEELFLPENNFDFNQIKEMFDNVASSKNIKYSK